MKLILLALGITIAAAAEGHTSLPFRSITKDPGTTLVLFGMRHGNRNPETFVGQDKSKWGQEGPLELSKFGKRQALGFGEELRKFLGNSYIQPNYLPKEAEFYSSSAPRCQMTLQACLAGLYTPVDWADWETTKFDHWSPVPYKINDPLLRMYAVENCPNSDKAWEPISKDTWAPLSQLTRQKKELLEYMSRQTGWKPELAKAADLADNLIQVGLYNASYPAWLERPRLRGYDKKKLIDAYLEFAESHQIACADKEECRNMMAGYWLKHVLDSVKAAAAGKGPKLIGYASHTEVTLALQKLMGYARKELTTSAGFVIEFKPRPRPSLRLLDHDPDPIDKHVIYKAKLTTEFERLQDRDGFIPLSQFERAVSKYVISDWEGACGRQNSCSPRG